MIHKKWFGLFLLLLPYLGYIYFIIHIDQASIDYETFMQIGESFILGGEVYGENSYYPLPFVMVFAIFKLIPRPLSMAMWFLIPVFAALLIQKFDAKMLLFAPLASHFFGGQSAVFALLGLWGYRKFIKADQFWGGFWLAIMTMKPQLAVFSGIWALIQWANYFREHKKIPLQSLSFVGTMMLIYIPSFIIWPDWPLHWLSSPRPLFERALSGLFPRTLLLMMPQSTSMYWIVLFVLSTALLFLVWRLNQKKLTYDLFMITSFILNPFVHDYDLIQLIPILDNRKMKNIALWISIPCWVVILFFYANDQAWFVFTFVAPALLWQSLKIVQKKRLTTEYK